MDGLYCIENVQLDLYQNKYTSIRVKQNDMLSRYVRIICTNNKDIIKLNKDECKCKVIMNDSNNDIYSYDVDVESDGTVIADLTQAIKINGKSKLELQISSIDEEKRISTMPLEIIVEKNVY